MCMELAWKRILSNSNVFNSAENIILAGFFHSLKNKIHGKAMRINSPSFHENKLVAS